MRAHGGQVVRTHEGAERAKDCLKHRISPGELRLFRAFALFSMAHVQSSARALVCRTHRISQRCSSSIGLTPPPAGRTPKARRTSPLCLCTRGALMSRMARGGWTNRRYVNRNLHRRNAAALQRAPRPHIMVDGTEVPVRSSGRGAKPHRRYSPRARMRADPVSIRAAKASRRPIKGRRAGRAQPATPEPTVYRTGVR